MFPVISDIVLEPSNTAVVEGEWMNMNCLTINQSEVRKWSFYSYNRIASTIYRPGFSGRLRGLFEHFDVEINANGPVSISANSTRLKDAGVYTCHCGIDGRDAEYKAHLIVLGKNSHYNCNFTTYSLLDIYPKIDIALIIFYLFLSQLPLV